MDIRTATVKDLDRITEVEALCFPPLEAASRKSFIERLEQYSNRFLLLEMDGRLVSFINGMASDEDILRDEMFENASLHKEDGAWQMIFGVNTIPEYRKRGYAGIVMERVIHDVRAEGKKGLILTCKEALIPYYSKFGFEVEGVSESTHGNAKWYQMRLVF